MLTYASVPLYRLFCQITGFGGTTQVASQTPDKIYDRDFVISFTSNVEKKLPWEFKPMQGDVRVKLGEQRLVFYEVTNKSDKDIIGTSTYNVTPFEIGPYFNKIQCFCFEEQLIKAGETVTFPVSFFVDPDMREEADLDKIKHVTLSYSFFQIPD